MRKLVMFILALLVLLLVWYKILPLWNNSSVIVPSSDMVVESEAIESNPHEFIPSTSAMQQNNLSLNEMLKKGIKTKVGIIKSYETSSGSGLSINGNTMTELQAQSPIELTNLFAIENSQIFLISYNQGGNQCAIQYQFIIINDSGYKLTSLFGNCLPYANVVQNLNKVNIKFHSNNEYASSKDFIEYQYVNGVVKQIIADKSDRYYLKKYANLSAKGIMALALKDGCASDGILNYDNACRWGKKYCTMFKALKNPVKDADYKILQDFCN